MNKKNFIIFSNINYREFLLIPNIISIIRIFLLIPFGIFIALNSLLGRYLTLFFGFLIIATDIFDGFLARKLNMESELGKILDPLSDKISFIFIAVLFVYFKNLPIWIMLLIIIRESSIFIGGFYLLSVGNKGIVSSNILGKISTNLMAIAFLSILILGMDSIFTIISLFISLFMFIFSGINYFIINFIKKI